MDSVGHQLKDGFEDATLWDRAITHRSWAVENGGSAYNERLEFLGDAVVELCVTQLLVQRFPELAEGRLSQIRQQLVNTTSLAGQARALGLHQVVKLGNGEEMGGGRDRDRLLAGTFEAVVAAVYLDRGLAAALGLIQPWFAEQAAQAAKADNPKNVLQQRVQAEGKAVPVYRVTQVAGPDHARDFTVEVEVDGVVLGQGQGPSKRAATRAAAQAALQAMVT